MDLVGKFRWCDIRHGCGIPETILQGLPMILEWRGGLRKGFLRWRKGLLEEGFLGGRVSWKKGTGEMDAAPPCTVSTVSTIFEWLVNALPLPIYRCSLPLRPSAGTRHAVMQPTQFRPKLNTTTLRSLVGHSMCLSMCLFILPAPVMMQSRI